MSTVYTPVYHLNMTEPASNIPTLRTASGEYITGWVEAMRTEIEGLTPERYQTVSIEIFAMLAVIEGLNARIIELEQSIEKPRRARGWWPR